MNFKKSYKKAIGYTPICKIGECSLKKLEFGIIELEAGGKQEFDTLDKETAFIMLEGHCNVSFDETRWENIGNRNTVFENRKAESFYMPREQKLLIEAIDHVKIAVCATPVSEKTEPQLLREDHVVLKLLGDEGQRVMTIPVVVLQTVAANLGSMLTPIGNPQNLYLYAKSGLFIGNFLLLMLPYTLISLVLLLIADFLFARFGEMGKSADLGFIISNEQKLNGGVKVLWVYLGMFVLCLLTVAHVVSVWITLAVVLVVQLLLDREVLRRVDYSLLLTFVGFFVFIGNMGRIPVFSNFLQQIIVGNEVITSVVASQAISNVPAALLLSGFTENYEALIIGTNLGGLGTLIASMASLISYKYIGKESEKGVIGSKGKYFATFTIVNICFLAVLMIVHMIIQ